MNSLSNLFMKTKDVWGKVFEQCRLTWISSLYPRNVEDDPCFFHNIDAEDAEVICRTLPELAYFWRPSSVDGAYVLQFVMRGTMYRCLMFKREDYYELSDTVFTALEKLDRMWSVSKHYEAFPMLIQRMYGVQLISVVAPTYRSIEVAGFQKMLNWIHERHPEFIMEFVDSRHEFGVSETEVKRFCRIIGVDISGLERKIDKEVDEHEYAWTTLYHTYDLKTASYSRVENKNMCSGCMIRGMEIVFDNCGHACCRQCSLQLTRCHLCRGAISKKIEVDFFESVSGNLSCMICDEEEIQVLFLGCKCACVCSKCAKIVHNCPNCGDGDCSSQRFIYV